MPMASGQLEKKLTGIQAPAIVEYFAGWCHNSDAFVETERGQECKRLRCNLPLSTVSRYLHRGVFCLSPESLRFHQGPRTKSQGKVDVRATCST